MSVSVVVPVWNGRDLLAKLLDTIDTQTLRPDEVLIVDNGSEDGAPELAERRGARIVRLGRNTGFAHAVNHGIGESKSQRIAIVNSDVELEPEWLQKLCDANAPFASGKILIAAHPELLDGTYDLICRGGLPWRAGEGKRDNPFLSTATHIHSAPFTAALFDRHLFETIGLLDERFESYLEDVDFGIRCAAHGTLGAYVPGAICRHRGSATLGRWHSDSVRRMGRNQIYLIAKHYPTKLILKWLWPIFLAHSLWGVLALRHSVGWSWIRGKGEGLAEFLATRKRSGQIPESVLREVLLLQEDSIYQLQREMGMDAYWRIYFTLTAFALTAKAGSE